MKAFILSSSPRRDGNSAMLARAAADGLRESGHDAALLFADDVLAGFLRDCRRCRKPDGGSGIEDGFRAAFFDHYLPAQGFIAATPIYWYGMSAQLKAFFDRMFCYYAASYPGAAEVGAGMLGKRIGLLMSSEETFPTVSAALLHQMQEFARYTRSSFAGAVHGYGNARGDVARDPAAPLEAARAFGRTFFTRLATDYQLDTARAPRMWSA